MDLTQALQLICANAVKADRATVLASLGDDTQHCIATTDGRLEFLSRRVPPRAHSVSDLTSLATAIARFGRDVTVWASLNDVVAVLDDGPGSYRDSIVSFCVAQSHVFDAIRDFPSVLPIQGSPAKGILRHLRTEMRPATMTPEDFDLALHNVRMETTDTLATDHANKVDRIGRSVRAEVACSLELPDTVSFRFHPYPALIDAIPGQVTVGCSVTVDPLARTIVVKALPGELEAAETEATRLLQAAVVEAVGPDVTVLCGQP